MNTLFVSGNGAASPVVPVRVLQPRRSYLLRALGRAGAGRAHHRKWIDDELQNHDEGSEVVHRGDGQPLRLELEHFIDRINDRMPARSDGASALAVIETLERINTAVAESSRY